jgi:hypothetical protein
LQRQLTNGLGRKRTENSTLVKGLLGGRTGKA